MARKDLLDFIKTTSKRESIDNIQDATIFSINFDGTYDLRLRSGAIKKNAVNLKTDESFTIGDVVNISMVSGTKETAKILGRSTKRKKEQKVVFV
jgi:hypothetical protein